MSPTLQISPLFPDLWVGFSYKVTTAEKCAKQTTFYRSCKAYNVSTEYFSHKKTIVNLNRGKPWTHLRKVVRPYLFWSPSTPDLIKWKTFRFRPHLIECRKTANQVNTTARNKGATTRSKLELKYKLANSLSQEHDHSFMLLGKLKRLKSSSLQHPGVQMCTSEQSRNFVKCFGYGK